ncbi:suppressor of lurcher protein 1-like [Maniola hyperantus]|uniref:suppressor of lurcher protein 1-like n=1 Tax=Aphantopus hyperantus TaxID=2795564 RepID=UPI0015692E9A|nr:suppressor of lurcher protein 1-like isoform X1 [Maniola hyperantus]XP_034828595.1 suppressor of lurcher protein 1-like isoform X1 [Maniola hyperantus]
MQPRGFKNMKASTALILLVHLSLHTVDEGHAINPSCSCIRFTSTHGKERGTFSSPDYPRPYPLSVCLLYTFLAEPHQIVELVFTDFDIYKEHLDCTGGDYIKVYSEGGVHGPGPPGINEYTSWSRILCGNRADAPPALYSHGPVMVLELKSGEKPSNASGFIGTYRFIDGRNFETDGVKVMDSQCDYVFASQTDRPTHGRLYSPRYPSSYPSNVRCNYHFNARKHERIKLVFEELYLQKGDESCLNRADIIKVFDGRISTAPVIAMLCNEIVGYEILSTGPDLLVQFTANSDTPGQGFKASYQFLMEDNSSAGLESNKKSSIGETTSAMGPAVSAATSSCDQVFRSDKSRNGKLISPLYPSPYPPNTQCHYDFLARGRERVRLVFEDFSLQRVTGSIIDCESMDSLDVFLYVDGRLEKMASYCGNDIPKPIMSNGPKLSMEFRGIYSSRYSRGFKISYYFVEDYAIATGKQLPEFPCAFVYNSTERRKGVMTSPNHPGLYPRDTECNYFFYARKNERVHVHFTHFDVEGVVPCEAVSASDYVQFASQMIDTQSRRYCGQLRELQVASEGNFLRITFRSNDRLDGTGFRAEYIFLKDTEMQRARTDSSGTPSHESARCWWFIGLLLIVTKL